MPHDVIMPALGMAQDTGKLLAWCKAPGDAVAAGEVLFEVETDKAAMEVEADRDGWLGATYAAVGEDVPVGRTVAILSAEPPENPVALAMAEAKPEAKPANGAAPVADSRPSDPAPAGPAKPSACPKDGRILASPRARRLAAERGLDLARLVAAGHPQPYHAADLETLAALPANAAPSAQQYPATVAGIVVEAAADPAQLDALVADLGADMSRTLAAFAAGALRQSISAAPVTVELREGPKVQTLTDPDFARSSADGTAPAFILRNLTATRVTKAPASATGIPTLTLTRAGNALTIRLDADPDRMGEVTALDFIAGFAERIEDPMRQLL
ncbi:biotin/lipoyl-containing protein [Acuticoccus sp. MNP-M23]|uniref:biotin/lipoyl-containing protein n=1 Tax=Acuticoccus sp. MNP-M23 TaxID=3072793 RepID=UPI002815A319|nr:biotin/lipoyl-containing protein [Acuticoccus sp. MNP-M23]WMS41359.1 biotin/lipoyl-containing protein [Acuticoccus sp. MNP-M23]